MCMYKIISLMFPDLTNLLGLLNTGLQYYKVLCSVMATDMHGFIPQNGLLVSHFIISLTAT